jgi:hypothetical protein
MQFNKIIFFALNSFFIAIPAFTAEDKFFFIQDAFSSYIDCKDVIVVL